MAAVRSGRRSLAERLGIEAVGEDQLDRTIRQGSCRQRPGAGSLETFGPVALAESDDAQTRPVSLLWVGARRHDLRGQRRGIRSGLFRPGDDARWSPLRMSAVRVRHVSGVGGVSVGDRRTQVGGDAPSRVEHLDRHRRGAHVDSLADQLVGHRVVVAVGLYVVVDVDLDADLPGPVAVADGRHRSMTGRSSCSNSSRRVPGRRLKGRSFSQATSFLISVFASARE